MKNLNTIKNWAIILDFVVSGIAAGIQASNPTLSGQLFGVSAVILFVAFVCVIIEMVTKKKNAIRLNQTPLISSARSSIYIKVSPYSASFIQP